MTKINIQEMSLKGIQVGLGIAIIPAAVTSLIACSKIILINIIVDTAVRILTANAYTATVSGFSFVAVPLLWKVSLAAAILGVSIAALSLTAAMAETIYHRYRNTH